MPVAQDVKYARICPDGMLGIGSVLRDEVAGVKRDEPTFADYLAMLRRRWRLAVGIGAGIAFASIAVVFALPAVYEATATIQIERPQIPDTGVQTTDANFAEGLMASVTQRVLAPEIVAGVIERFDLYPDGRGSVPIEDLVDDFRENTVVTPDVVQAVGSTGRTTAIAYAFTVAFRYEEPEIASAVANELARLHMEQNTVLRKGLAAQTSAFLQAEADKVEKRILEIDARLTAMQSKVGGSFVNENPLLVAQRFEQTDRELAQVEDNLRDARERRDLLESDLLQTPQYRPLLNNGQPVVRGSDRLAAAQQELLALQARYSDDHPDIIRLKREISGLTGGAVDYRALAAQLRLNILAAEQDLATAQKAYSDSHPDVVRLKRTLQNLRQQLGDAERGASSSAAAMPPPDNPVYLQLVTRLQSAEQEIRDLSSRRSQLQGRLGQYAYNPKFEATYTPLVRERDLLQTQYRDLREKYTQAALATSVATDEKGQMLTLVEPARPPASPIEPNRLMLSLLGLVLALGAAFGSASLADAMDTTVRGSRDVAVLLNKSPIATIPYIYNPDDFQKRRKKRIAMAVAAVSMCVIAVVLIT